MITNYELLNAYIAVRNDCLIQSNTNEAELRAVLFDLAELISMLSKPLRGTHGLILNGAVSTPTLEDLAKRLNRRRHGPKIDHQRMMDYLFVIGKHLARQVPEFRGFVYPIADNVAYYEFRNFEKQGPPHPADKGYLKSARVYHLQ